METLVETPLRMHSFDDIENLMAEYRKRLETPPEIIFVSEEEYDSLLLCRETIRKINLNCEAVLYQIIYNGHNGSIVIKRVQEEQWNFS